MAITAYVSIAEADIYLAVVPFTAVWDDLSDSDKTKYLVAAQRAIDLLSFRGRKYKTYNEGQEEEWPRVIDGVTVGWNSTTGASEIPQRVQDAVCEEVLMIVNRGDPSADPRQEAQSQGVTKIRLPDGMTEEYSGQRSYRNLGLLSLRTYNLLRWYLATVVSVI